MRQIEMREAAAACVVTALVMAGVIFAFGYQPPRAFQSRTGTCRASRSPAP